MLRNTLLLAVCCLTFVLGCEKKQAQQPPAPRRGAGVQAPPGLVVLGEKPPVFLTKSPVSVAQYVQYLKDSGQPVPEGMRSIALGGPGGEQPVTGLTRKQAEGYAAWDLKRLPTQQEWAMASLYVAPTPYPWAGQDTDLPVTAPIYLVQDWLPGSPGEKTAAARKQALMDELEKERAAGFEQTRSTLAKLVATQKTAAQQRWDQFRKPFFNLVDKQKQLAELTEKRKARSGVAEILQKAYDAKYKLAAVIALGEGGEQAATKTYTDLLAQMRTDVQSTRQTLEDQTKGLQAQVLQQTDAFDQLGPRAISDRFSEAEAVLQQSAQAPEQPKDAAALQSKMVEATQKLQDAEPLFESLPDPSSLDKQAAEVEAQISTAGPDTAGADKVAQLKDHFQGLGQKVNHDFLDEKLLLQDLDTLVDLRARREAVQANLAALTGVMRQLSTPEAAPAAAPAAAPETTAP